MPDRPVPEVEEMPRRERGAGEAVAGDDGHARLRPGLDGDDGEIGGQVRDRAGGVGLRCDHENPVDALGAEAPDGVQDGDAVEGEEAHDADEVARPVRGALDAEERRGRAVERGVEAHDPERLRLPGGKCTRHRVRPVVEHAHRREDSLARVVLDVVAAVDDPRDRLVRDPCELRDVGHDRSPRACGRPVVTDHNEIRPGARNVLDVPRSNAIRLDFPKMLARTYTVP